nr:hypothetical protein [Tanacetum cinerariifolium]
INKVNLKSVEVADLNASLQEKVLLITALKEQLKGKSALTKTVSLNPIDPALLQLLEAIEKRFSGNVVIKKTQKNILKQQFENFSTLILDMLDQTFDMLQKLVSQLELLGEKLSQEDVNQKLLRSLSPKWKTHVIVWRNKTDLDTMSMDDLYNNLKVYEPEVKRTSSSNSITIQVLGQHLSPAKIIIVVTYIIIVVCVILGLMEIFLYKDGNEVRSSVEQGTTAMENLVENLGNNEDKVEYKKLKKELEEA